MKKCDICNNKPKQGFGYCNNIDGKGDVYDCCDYVDKDWMVNWVRRLNEKDKEPYVPNFVKWVRDTISIGGKK